MTLLDARPGLYINEVWHRRNQPASNEFKYKTTSIWLDPDKPDDALSNIGFAGKNKRNPICFRRQDHLARTNQGLRSQADALMADLHMDTRNMKLRLLTQPRLWGWLFNPISIYVFFDGAEPAASLLEVTNTPWKQSHCYGVSLNKNDDVFEATFPKQLHVSPFLGMNYTYHLTINNQTRAFQIDVLNESGEAVLNTAIGGLKSSQQVKSIFANAASTHKTSAAIHWQALKLASKRVKFVKHPSK